MYVCLCITSCLTLRYVTFTLRCAGNSLSRSLPGGTFWTIPSATSGGWHLEISQHSDPSNFDIYRIHRIHNKRFATEITTTTVVVKSSPDYFYFFYALCQKQKNNKVTISYILLTHTYIYIYTRTFVSILTTTENHTRLCHTERRRLPPVPTFFFNERTVSHPPGTSFE